jgi:hypothetical protein
MSRLENLEQVGKQEILKEIFLESQRRGWGDTDVNGTIVLRYMLPKLVKGLGNDEQFKFN